MRGMLERNPDVARPRGGRRDALTAVDGTFDFVRASPRPTFLWDSATACFISIYAGALSARGCRRRRASFRAWPAFAIALPEHGAPCAPFCRHRPAPTDKQGIRSCRSPNAAG